MIKFFRTIRKSLFMENKTSKYFKYAIGEIVLVIIGILIALQINNWNIENSNKKIEKQLLISLKDDFTKTKINIEKTIELQTNVLNLTKSLMIHYLEKKYDVSKDSMFAMIVTGTSSFWRIEPINGTYQSMLSSGDSKLLKNKNLLQSLTEFNGEVSYGFEDHNVCLDLILKIIDELGDHSFLVINPKFYYDNYKTPKNQKQVLKIELQKLYKNKSLFVKVDNKLDLEANRLQWQVKMLEDVDKVLKEINEELKRFNND